VQNLNSYFIEKGFFLEGGQRLLEMHADNHLVRLRMGEKRPHLGILHYKDEVVFGKGQWTNFAKACRGVVVDFNQKKILSYPFKKFFNLFESHTISLAEAEKRTVAGVMEKLDGSMIEIFYDETTKQFVATTKGSLDSEQGQYASTIIPASVQSKSLVNKYTIMMELISPRYTIVVPYDKKAGYEEGLYLIGVREMISEKLFEPDEVQAFAKEYGLKTFKTYRFPTIQSIVDNAKTLPFMDEGYVVRFAGEELMVKIKGAEYLRVHRFLNSLSDKNLLDVMIAGLEENVMNNIGMVPEEYRDSVIETLEGYKKEAIMFRGSCYEWLSKVPNAHSSFRGDRKIAAVWIKGNVPKEYHKFIFNLLDGKDVELKQVYTMMRRR
jgi:hypothetical protein